MISVLDPKGLTLREVKNATFVRGRYSDELQLSSFVFTGLWTIRVQLRDEVRKI